MSDPTPGQVKAYQELMDQGPWRFILIRGVLAWGIGTSLLFSVFMAIFGQEPFLEIFAYSIVIFPIGGIFWGVAMWFWFKWASKKK